MYIHYSLYNNNYYEVYTAVVVNWCGIIIHTRYQVVFFCCVLCSYDLISRTRYAWWMIRRVTFFYCTLCINSGLFTDIHPRLACVSLINYSILLIVVCITLWCAGILLLCLCAAISSSVAVLLAELHPISVSIYQEVHTTEYVVNTSTPIRRCMCVYVWLATR